MASSVSSVLLLVSFGLLAAAYFFRDAGYVNGSISSATTTHLRFYMHDDYASPHPTAALVVPGRPPLSDSTASSLSPRRFGDIAVMNNALTEGPGRGSALVGTAQGFTVRVAERGAVNALSLHLVMEAGEYGGSSLAVMGRVDTDAEVRESIIVGGTGRFRSAGGYALSRSYDYDMAKGGVVEIDVYVHMLDA